MTRYNRILKNPMYSRYMEYLAKKEEDRAFCRHDIEHCLDVARIAFILAMENGVTLGKDIVYGAALLHDIGRVFSVEKHHQESVRAAKVILGECGYSTEEIILICDAIESHRENTVTLSDLRHILAAADKMSRQCYKCSVSEECYWEENKKNMEIKY